jgi:putative solute:sodium symporter small subunit
MFIFTRNTRIGFALFAVYSLSYGSFVLLAAFSPEMMEAMPLAGVNLAIWYGFGLIVAAILLALVYGWACRSAARSTPDAIDSHGGRP